MRHRNPLHTAEEPRLPICIVGASVRSPLDGNHGNRASKTPAMHDAGVFLFLAP